MSRRLASAVVALALVLCAAPALAHQTSVKFVELTVDRADVAITVRVAPGDVTEPLQLPADSRPSAGDAAASPAVAAYVRAWIALRAGGAPCVPTPAHALADDDGRFVAVEWRATCAEPIADLTLDFARFFAVDTRHTAIVQLVTPDHDSGGIPVAAGDPPLVLHVGGGGPSSLGAWVRIGVDHIYGGRDHICFVLALLLVIVIARPAGAWETRTPWAALRATAKIVTAFTIAHSLTLIGASLGWFALPGRVVETAIALSIAYTAAENIIRPDVRWRFVLTFGFGLVHGMGFASSLAVLLPPHDVIAPLLCFNVGVELGQLTIVLIALPVLLIIARTVGAVRYRRVVMPVLSSVIGLLGLVWVIERAFRITLIGM